jgi:hypothetical protein
MHKSSSSSPFILPFHPLESQGRKEPLVLPRLEPLLKHLLDILPGVFPCADFLECIMCHNTLQSLKLECVPRRHQMVVVDYFDEWLDTRMLMLALRSHTFCDLLGVTVDTGIGG